MGNRAAIFKKVADSRSSGGGDYLTQGKYRLVVDKLICPQKEAGLTFIAELRVKSSESIPGAMRHAGKEPSTTPELASPVGSSRTYLQQLEKFKSAAGNTKAFVEALFGAKDMDKFDTVLDEITNEDPTAKDAEGALLPVNPMRGYEIEGESYVGKTKGGPNKDNLLTLFKWRYVEVTDEQVAANIAWLNSGAKP